MQTKQPTLKPPVLPKKFLGRTLPGGQLVPYGRYGQLSLTREQFNGQHAEHLSFEEMLFKQVGLSATELAHARFVDSRLSACDLANAHWSQADCARVELLDCRLTGFRATESRWQDVLFKDCQASLAQFRFATFKTARFEHCDLSDADFQGADLTGVVFVACDLSRVELSGAKLAGADLRDCVLDGVHAGLSELHGAIIDPSQALALVQAFGIVVVWPGQGAHET
ncbi:MAG: pentapeptide repeat-containing protein [Ktedonobacteraceae bacterium]